MSLWRKQRNKSDYSTQSFSPQELRYCAEGQYACKGGRACVNSKFICDGSLDCPQGDDEKNCSKKQKCKPGFYQCSRISRCIPLFLVCNGFKDCVNGDDESEEGCLWNARNHNASHSGYRRWSDSNGQSRTRVNVTKITPEIEIRSNNYSHVGSGIFFINFGTTHLSLDSRIFSNKILSFNDLMMFQSSSKDFGDRARN
ncbi:hypothetical protein B4U79_18136 [Dinothrombium tinctorium]|uniref:Uncharacterized protein n=1 Tax=Dinothrombium tinctorium TaxID=1965070 RepID=A0A3S4QXV6_9ACAR|nr:hypothetical protein B4U79_18298 [Dinothrombium tinctorium]RWS09055.1 hypothetical protein B4U79_18136 [Dinothrombium tinctorium]